MSVNNRTPLLTHVNSDIKQLMSGKDKTNDALSSETKLNIEVVSNGFSTSRAKVLSGDIKSVGTDSETLNECSPQI